MKESQRNQLVLALGALSAAEQTLCVVDNRIFGAELDDRLIDEMLDDAREALVRLRVVIEERLKKS